MNKERIHNQLALLLGYDRLVNNKRIDIKVDYKNPDDPKIMLVLPGGVTKQFHASDNPAEVSVQLTQVSYEKIDDVLNQEIKDIVKAVHQAYLNSINM